MKCTNKFWHVRNKRRMRKLYLMKKSQHKASNSGKKIRTSLSGLITYHFPRKSHSPTPRHMKLKKREIYTIWIKPGKLLPHPTPPPHTHTSLLSGLILRGHPAIQLVILRIFALSKKHLLCTTCYINFTRMKDSEFTPLRFAQIHYKSTKTFINVGNNCTIFKFYLTKLFE
jgi:hypothetical protein